VDYAENAEKAVLNSCGEIDKEEEQCLPDQPTTGIETGS
jgi:hypothetical protein